MKQENELVKDTKSIGEKEENKRVKYVKDTLYKRLIQSSKWAKVRNKFIQEHPTCDLCGHPATEVHHRIPLMRFRNDPAKMEQMAFDEDNLQSLCRDCHEKLHKELGKNKNKKEHAELLRKEKVETFYKNYFE